MNTRLALGAALVALGSAAALAQESSEPAFGEVLVTAQRQNAPFYRQDRPVVGLRRPADGAVMPFVITSDTRDEPTRRQEIYTVLLAAIDRAAAGGFELVSGNFQLRRITRENYKELVLMPTGRIDTSRVDLMVKGSLNGSADAAQKRLLAFVNSLKKGGRATVDANGGIALSVVNPDQYREEIYRRIAAAAKLATTFYGTEYGAEITGLDREIGWAQVSNTEVFLYIPYGFTVRK